MTTVTILGLKARSEFVENCIPPFSKNGWASPKFRITLTYQGSSARFTYYGSHHDYLERVTKQTDLDLSCAVEHILSDALYTLDGFEEFCADLGFEEDDKEAKRIFRACERSKERIADRCRDLEMEAVNAGRATA